MQQPVYIHIPHHETRWATTRILVDIYSLMASSPVDSKTPAKGIQYEAGGMSNDENVLQKHVAFFDQNEDGVVYPWETFKGFRQIGCGLLLSFFGAIFVNTGLSSKTRPGKLPSLLFPIEIKNIQYAKHGSDTDVYDNEGRFVPSKFEEIFKKHARTSSCALTSNEVMAMVKSNREPQDYAGWLASYIEWKALYVLGKDENGLLHRDTIRAVYDGSLFQRMAKEKAASSGN